MKPDKKNIEEFTKYLIKEAQLESPSSDFVNKVMNAVELEAKPVDLKNYKPLISKLGWIIILVCVAVTGFFMISGTPQSSTLLEKIDFTFLETFKPLLETFKSINLFEGIRISKLFTFSFVFFSALVILQIFIIKNYFNRQNIV